MRCRIQSIIMLAFAAVLAWRGPCQAQAEPRPQNISAMRTARTIRLDGKLDEPDWSKAQPLDQFLEYYPNNRSAAPERTEARLLYDDRYLYVGLRMQLRDILGLRRPFVRRDKVGASHDYVQIYLDPQGSRRGSYIFRVNARGTKTDGFQNEALRTETLDPDYDWDVATSIDDKGWSAEMRIPLSTLRISASGAQTWAVIVTRGIPRAQNTQMATAPFPRQSSCFLCFASSVSFPDLRADKERLILTPSATLTSTRRVGAPGRRSDNEVAPSLDAKWLPSDNLAVDLTIKPDFSQVDADQTLLTANQRFAVSLPEKRPFFREGADLISTPLPIIYTRSIAAPDYGLRMTRRGSDLEATGFLTRDGGQPAIVEPGLLGSSLVLPDFDSYDGFARLRRNAPGGETGGVIAAKFNTDGSYNLVSGFDLSQGDSNNRVLGQVLYSDTRNPNRPDLSSAWTGQGVRGGAAIAEWDHTGADVWLLRYQRLDRGFRSWLGYIPRVGFQEEDLKFQHPVYLPSGRINSVSPYLSATYLQPIGQAGGEHDVGLGANATGFHNLNVDLSIHPSAAVLDTAGQTRATSYVAWSAFMNPAPRIPLISFSGQAGRLVDFANGDVVPARTLSLRIITRPLDRFDLELRRDTNDLLSSGDRPQRLKESVNQIITTFYIGPEFYLLLNLQDYHEERRFPSVASDHELTGGVQLNWAISRSLQVYGGVRTSQTGAVSADRSQTTEIYFKLSRTLRI